MNEQTKLIIEEIENELMNELRRIMELQTPPTAKGGSYEDSIKDFFEKYLGSVYDFHTRVSIIDFLGLCFKEFKPIENEFDIVATFKTAVPRIILQRKQQKFIPYDSVVFIIQVKQDLDKAKLKSDLEKLEKVRSLPMYPERMPVAVEYPETLFVGSPEVIPLSILFYLRKSIKDNVIKSLLEEFNDCWDFLLIVEDRKLLINRRIVKNLNKLVKETLRTLKIRKGDSYGALLDAWEKEVEDSAMDEYFVEWNGQPLITLMCLIPSLTPYPIICNSTAFFLMNVLQEPLALLLGSRFAEILLEKIKEEGGE